jgi:hypothetical protein
MSGDSGGGGSRCRVCHVCPDDTRLAGGGGDEGDRASSDERNDGIGARFSVEGDDGRAGSMMEGGAPLWLRGGM